MANNREDAMPKSLTKGKADGVYDNPSPLYGADISVYDNMHTWYGNEGILPHTKVKLKKMTGLESQLEPLSLRRKGKISNENIF